MLTRKFSRITCNLHRNSSKNVIQSFSNPREAFKNKTTFQLFRAKIVFSFCKWKWLVRNSESILKKATKIFGRSFVNSIIKITFFGHFCAGENENSIKPTIHTLRNCGVGAILDYAAESDVNQADSKENEEKNLFTARTFEYHGEESCDTNMRIFLNCISSVQAVTPEGFAAIKVTALGLPEILERVSIAIKETKNFFKHLDHNLDGIVTYEEWRDTFQHFNLPISEIDSLFSKLTKSKSFDYVSWTTASQLEDIWSLFAIIEKVSGKKLIDSGLNTLEVAKLRNMVDRLYKIAEFAEQRDVRLMVDAEQTYFQPAINYLVHLLQVKHNRKKPIIFHTYQCYLRDSYQRVEKDIERAKRENYFFAAKIVRGAYIVSERARAKLMNYSDPICENIEETHNNYHSVIDLILSKANKPSLLIASHNQKSVEFVVRKMDELKIDPINDHIYFGQLLGMADHLTFSLGNNNYKAYKYVPYGPVHEVIPYLIRRAHENSSLLAGGNTEIEVNLITKELWSRLKKE